MERVDPKYKIPVPQKMAVCPRGIGSCLVKEMNIRRLEVEKFCTAMQQLLEPLELGKKTQIVVDYDPGQPVVRFRFYEEK